jgi:hypothetical protein
MVAFFLFPNQETDMSDSLATRDTLVTPSNGQAAQASDTQAESSAGQQTSNGQSATDENIRKLQSTYDRKLAETNRQLQQANQVAQQMQQRLQEMEDRNAPDDFSRLELQKQRAEARAAQLEAVLQQKYQAEAEANARDNILTEIATRYGVSKSALEKADDRDHAVELALEARAAKNGKQQQLDDDKRERNMPDLGGGAPRTAGTQAEAEWDELVRTKDSTGQMRWLRLHGGK